MLLIVELILTGLAFSKGWRWQALMPLGSGLVAGFSLGRIMGPVAGSSLGTLLIGLLIDIAVIVVLVGMVVGRPKPSRPQDQSEA